MTPSAPGAPAPLRRLLGDARRPRQLVQAATLAGLVLAAALLLRNLLANLHGAGAGIDFSFLGAEAGFDVNESLIPYDARDSYARALAAGLLNTLHLTVACILGATAIGVVVGLAQLGEARLVRVICRTYVETMRNLPKLLVLLAIYVALVRGLPTAREAISVFDLAFLSNRGLAFPALRLDLATLAAPRAAAAALGAAALGWAVWRALGGRAPRALRRAAALAAGAAALVFGAGAARIEIPVFQGFNFEGGSAVSVQYFALAVALSVYQGAQVAEVVRSGVQSVPRGQTEAALSLGLSRRQAAWMIVLPQALRVMIPPMTSQYLNALKNTSIGLAVGYSDLVSIMNTAVNQTFRPVELMTVTLAVYLAVGWTATAALTRFERRVALRERGA